MKRVEAIIRHFKLEEVKQALCELGVQGMTVFEVQGFGRQKGNKDTYRGVEYTVNFLPKVMIVLYVTDDMMERVFDTIITKSRTGQIGDGKIAVTDLADVARIRTGENGIDAL